MLPPYCSLVEASSAHQYSLVHAADQIILSAPSTTVTMETMCVYVCGTAGDWLLGARCFPIKPVTGVLVGGVGADCVILLW